MSSTGSRSSAHSAAEVGSPATAPAVPGPASPGPGKTSRVAAYGVPARGASPAAPASAVASDDPAAHELAVALPLITSRWKAIGGDLFIATGAPAHPPPVDTFQAAAYALVADSQVDVPPVQQALDGPGRAPYKQALEAALPAARADAPHVAALAAELINLSAGGQVAYNATQVMAHQALLSPIGKRAIAANRRVIEPFERYLAGACRAHGELEAADQLTRIAQVGISVPDPRAIRRGGDTRLQACTSIFGIVRGGATDELGAAPAPAGARDLATDPALIARAQQLTAQIDAVLAHHAPGTPLPVAQLARIQHAVDAAGPDVRDFVWADKVTVSKLVRAMDPGQAGALVDQLDPLERLYQACTGAVTGDEDPAQAAVIAIAMQLPVPQSVRDPRKQLVLKAGGGVFSALRDFLAAHASDAALRTRVLAHTRLKDECLDRLPPADQRVIYRMIARGSAATTPEDAVLDAAEEHRPADVVRGLRALAGTAPARLAALEHVATFRAAIDGMTAEISVDGQQVRPYQLAMALWGHRAGAIADPNAPRQGEINVPGADDTPLTIEERITLDRELFDAALTELHDEITGAHLDLTAEQRRFLEATRKIGNPQKVMDTLVKYDRLAATRFLPLLRRERLVFGAELEARYTQKYQQGLRTWIYEHAGPNNRSGSNRVLGTEQGAGVGMFNGQILAAGEVAQPGKMTLQQAMRENVVGGMPLGEIASVQARALARAVDASDFAGVLTCWTVFNGAVLACKLELEKQTGVTIRAIDLIRNAYQEQAGHLETRLAEKFEPAPLAQLRGALGLVPGLDDAPGAKPPSLAERAERQFAQPAKLLWEAIARLTAGSSPPEYVAVRVFLDTGRALPPLGDLANQAAEPRQLAAVAGHDVEEHPPRSFTGYYRAHYGASPELHLRAQVQSFGDDRGVPPELAAALVFGTARDSHADALTRPPAPDAEQVEIGPHNRALVRASFTAAQANANAADIWRILHDDGKLQLIETELYGPYNDEEQRLIRVAFRKLSGGLDLTFYIRQAIDARARAVTHPTIGPMGISSAMFRDPDQQSSAIGAGGGEINTRGSATELERGLAIAMTGELDVRTRVRNAVQRGEDGQVVRIVEELAPAERKQVLADGALVDAMQQALSQQNYERVFKVLTGQADLQDRMLSRTVGDTWWKKHISGDADAQGMEEDLKRYVDNLSLRFDRELRGTLAAHGQPPEAIDDAIKTRTRDACADLMADANIKDIIDRHLGKIDAARARSVLMNGGGEHDYLAAAGASPAEILDELRGLSARERATKLADPSYLRLLGQRLPDPKDYRDAMNTLRATGDPTGAGGLARLDQTSRTTKQGAGGSSDPRETLRALAALSPAELDRLRGDPQLQLQLLGALDTDDEKALARSLLFANNAGHAAADPGATARDFAIQQSAYRLRVACRTSNKWSVVLEEAIAVYKAALDDAPAPDAPGGAVASHPAVAQPSAARRTVWSEIAVDVAAFARDHDAHPGAVTSDQITGAQMVELIHKAVLRQADPSDALIGAKIWTVDEQAAAAGANGIAAPLIKLRGGDDQYDEQALIAALNGASDEHVAAEWTSIAATPAGGGTTLKQMYARYRTSFDAATPSLLRREAPGAADDDPLIAEAELRRQQFLQFVIQVSASLEAMLRPHMGDHRELTAATDPDHAKLSGTGNKRYDNLTEVVLGRVPRLSPDAVATAIQMQPGDRWLLTEGTRQQVGMFNLRHEKNLRSRGEQTSERSIASDEKQDLDTSRVRYGRAMAVSLTDGSIDAQEAANLDKLGEDNDRAREAYKTALDTAAMWASLVVGTLVTVAATILTGGLALGPVAAMAIGGATAALSATAKSLVNKSILDGEWDSRDTHDLIAKEVVTSLVTIGTTFYAQKLLAAVGSVGTVAKQANAARGVLGQQPPIWRVFLNQASEQVTSTAMSSVVEAGLEATDPRHWIDGYREGEAEAKAAGMARLAEVPGEIKNGVITSLLTAGIGHVIGRNAGHVEAGAAAAQRRSVSLGRNIKKVFGDPEQKITGALVEWAMTQRDPVDWSAAPAELLAGTIRQYNQVGTEMHTTTAGTASRARAGHDSVASARHDLTPAEQSAYATMNAHAGATDPFVSAKDYAGMRQQVAERGLGAWQAQHADHPLSPAQREAFTQWVRAAPDADTLAARAVSDPRSVAPVVTAGAEAAPGAARDEHSAAPKPGPARPARGPAIAARVPGASYQGEGRFRVATAQGAIEVRIERVSGSTPRLRNHPDGDGMLLEIPLGLGDAELDHAIVQQLELLRAPRHATPQNAPGADRYRAGAFQIPAEPATAAAGDQPSAPQPRTAAEHADAHHQAAVDQAHVVAHAAAASAPVRRVETDFHDLAYMTAMPPNVIAAHQIGRAQAQLHALPEADYRIFQTLHAALPSAVAQAFLYKALAANHPIGELQWFASQIVGKPDAWLTQQLTLGDFHQQGSGVQQQWSHSCNASTTITMRGNYDPVFALKVRMYNPDVSRADANDPMAGNANLAGMERQLLESPYQGQMPQLHGTTGVADTHASKRGRGRFADDLLNLQGDATGLQFTTRYAPSPTEVVYTLDRALRNGMQVPVVVGNPGDETAHYVLCQARRVTPDGEVEFQFHNTGDGRASWISATQIQHGAMNLAGYGAISVMEVPSSIAPAAAAQASAPPPAPHTPTESKPTGAPRPAPAELAPTAATAATAPEAHHATPTASGTTEAPSTTKAGLESLNSEGAYDYRLQRVERLRQDILTGSAHEISPDVSPEMIALMREHIGKLSNEQLAAIQGYTSQDYKAINAAMRNPEGDPVKAAKLAGYIKAIQAGLKQLPSYEGEVYRGTSMAPETWAIWERAYAQQGTVSDAAFSSSSRSEEVAADFVAQTRGDGRVSVFCKIQSRTGRQVEFLSKTANEVEVLFAGGAKFKVVYIADQVGADGLPHKEVMLREVVDDE